SRRSACRAASRTAGRTSMEPSTAVRPPELARPFREVPNRTYGLHNRTWPVTIGYMPRVSQDQLDARRSEILAGARACFARYGYEGATVRRLETETGLSRGAIFHHFRDKESLFLAVAQEDATAMAETVARN